MCNAGNTYIDTGGLNIKLVFLIFIKGHRFLNIIFQLIFSLTMCDNCGSSSLTICQHILGVAVETTSGFSSV